MDSSLFPVAGIVRLNSGLLEKALADLDRHALVSRIVENSNPMIWIAGHLTASRFGMAGLLGPKPDSPLGSAFGKGAVVADEAELPEAEEVLTVWRDVSRVLEQRLGEATAVQLAAPSPRPFPIADQTVRGALAFLTYHEGYHLGQLAIMRKALGVARLVDA